MSGRLGNHIQPTNGYASRKEADMAAKLHALARAGNISELEEQVVYELIPKQKGERSCTYRADFRYRDEDGQLVVMDVKGYKTEIYRIKKKLLLWRHGIRIVEA